MTKLNNLLIYLAGVSGIPGMLIYITAVGIIVIKGFKKLILANKITLKYGLITDKYGCAGYDKFYILGCDKIYLNN